MDIWQRILAAKDEKTAKKVSIFSGLGMLPFYIIFPLIGMTLKVVLEIPLENSADVAYTFLARHSTPFILGFAVVGLMAALMSSGDSFLNIISISAIKDFAGWKKKKMDIDPKKLHKSIRLISIIFGLVALLMALVLPKIVDLMVVGIASIVIFVPITFFALIKKDVSNYKKEALFSLLFGFIVNLGFFIWGTLKPEQMNNKSSFIPAFIVSSLVLIIGIAIRNKKLKK
jgi:SSS family solute:Na+ symporter